MTETGGQTVVPTFQEGRHSYDVRALVEAGMRVETNQLWSYESMAELLDRTVSGNDTAVQEAIKRLARDHAIEFKNVRKSGYVRLDDEGIVDQGASDRLGISRKIRRAALRTTNIRDWDSLSDYRKREADTHRSVITLMRSMLKPSTVRRVHQEVERTRCELDVEKTLRLFREK